MEILENITEVNMTDEEFHQAILKLLAEQAESDPETVDREPDNLLQNAIIHSIEDEEFYEMILSSLSDVNDDEDTELE